MEVANLSNIQFRKEEDFDVDSLPDLEEGESMLIDFNNHEKVDAPAVFNKEFLLSKEALEIENSSMVFDKKKVTINFKLSNRDISGLAKMTGGLVSTEVNAGSYEFTVIESREGKQELYYFDEFVGEIIEGKPQIYRKYFYLAFVRSMVKQEILFEYETGKFTIHPVFYENLQKYNAEVAQQLAKKGFPLVGTAKK